MLEGAKPKPIFWSLNLGLSQFVWSSMVLANVSKLHSRPILNCPINWCHLWTGQHHQHSLCRWGGYTANIASKATGKQCSQPVDCRAEKGWSKYTWRCVESIWQTTWCTDSSSDSRMKITDKLEKEWRNGEIPDLAMPSRELTYPQSQRAHENKSESSRFLSFLSFCTILTNFNMLFLMVLSSFNDNVYIFKIKRCSFCFKRNDILV